MGPYKERQNTSQTLSCSSVPLTLDLTGNSRLPPPLPSHTRSLSLTALFTLTHSSPESDRRERMAAPMWRMKGLWRRMAGVLVLCALLLSSEYTYGYYLQHPPCCSPDALHIRLSPEKSHISAWSLMKCVERNCFFAVPLFFRAFPDIFSVCLHPRRLLTN